MTILENRGEQRGDAFDAVIVGGGISGLWLFALLKNYGYEVLLLECERLGAGQTIASQGILHQGYKYLTGENFSRQIVREAFAASRLWHDLSSSPVAPARLTSSLISSTGMYYVTRDPSTPDLLARVAKELHLPMPREVLSAERPSVLSRDASSDLIFMAPEQVLDVPKLIAVLAGYGEGRICRIDKPRKIDRKNDTLILDGDITIQTKCVVFCAGLGNEDCARILDIDLQMQRRPLQMVIAGPVTQDLFAHFCLNSFAPELTITTHRDRDGQKYWYLGGQLAENPPPRNFIADAKDQLSRFLPGTHLANVDWKVHPVCRAEAAQADGGLPGNFAVQQHGTFMFAWPTKLCLVPAMCDKIRLMVEKTVGVPVRRGRRPSSQGVDSNVQIATPPWYSGAQ